MYNVCLRSYRAFSGIEQLIGVYNDRNNDGVQWTVCTRIAHRASRCHAMLQALFTVSQRSLLLSRLGDDQQPTVWRAFAPICGGGRYALRPLADNCAC